MFLVNDAFTHCFINTANIICKNLYTSNTKAQDKDRIYDTFFTDTDNTKLFYLSLSAYLHHLGQRRCVLAL